MTRSSSLANGEAPAAPRVTLALILALAFVLRLIWWALYVDVIENEGVVYARLAESLFAGDGLTSIFGGRDVMFPPGLPALIGLVAVVVGSVEIAGRVIGIVCGTALVGVLHALTRQLFECGTPERASSASAANVVALLAAVHPLLIALSVSMYSEGPWVFLVLCSAYGVVRSLTRPSAALLIAAGLAAGFGYLVRPEGLAVVAYFAFVLIAAGVLRRRTPGATARTAGVFVAAALVLAIPYIVYLSSLAGGFRWEGKSPYNNIQNERIRAGLTVPEAARGLDANGNVVGIFLNLHLDQAAQLRQPGGGSGELVETLFADPIARARRVARQTLTSEFISAPWVFLFALIGLVATAWWRTRLLEGLTLIGLSLLQGLLLFSVDQSWTRYFFPLLPLLLVWSGAGVEWLASLISLRFGPRGGTAAVAYAIAGIAAAVMVLAAFGPVRSVGELAQAEDRVSKEIGAWMAEDARTRSVSGRPIVMGIGLNSAYYAGGTMRYLPYADEAAALAYVHRMQPHYLVLRESDVRFNQTPYAAEWVQRGIPDRCAVLARDKWSSSPERARVWRWTCASP